MSTPAQNKHTPEPWSFVKHPAWPNFGHITPAFTDEMGLISEETGTRICHCINALAGIPDPEAAIRAAREALLHAEAVCLNVDAMYGTNSAHQVREALTLLTPKP